jgi:hypothetical protein
MAALFDQKQRHGVARLVGMRTPLNIETPIVKKFPTSKEMADSFLTSLYEKLPFALPSAEAARQIKDRQDKIAGGSLHEAEAEPVATKWKIP